MDANEITLRQAIDAAWQAFLDETAPARDTQETSDSAALTAKLDAELTATTTYEAALVADEQAYNDAVQAALVTRTAAEDAAFAAFDVATATPVATT